MKEKRRTFILPITTPSGVIQIPVQHHVVNESIEDMWTDISVEIDGQLMYFEAEMTVEVLIQLAKVLPKGWYIKSCLSCRHGHFCPVGNADNELFCVTDFEPKITSDLWHVTEDEEERRHRSRNLFHLCEKYIPQSKEYFTYSDYGLELNYPGSEEP